MLRLALFLALSALPGASARAQTIALPEGVKLTLPGQGRGSVEWLIPPSSSESSEVPISFAVDPRGRAWLIRDYRVIFVPQENALFKSDRPFQQLAWLSGGKALARSGEVLETFKPESRDSGNGLPEVHLKPLTTISLSTWKIAPAGRDGLYIAGYNSKKGLSQICLVGPALDARTLKVLFRTSAQISDVAGDGHATYFASGPSIWKLTAKGAKLVYARRKGDIRRLIYVSGAGIFFATDDSVGFAQGDSGFDFIQAPRPQIAAAKGELYVMLGGLSNGVLRVGGLSRFSRILKDWRNKG